MSDSIDPGLERLVGPLVMSGLDGEGLDERLGCELAEGHLGGFILFRADIPDLPSARAFVDQARSLSPTRLFIGIDEEGGFVSQIDGVDRGASAGVSGTSEPADEDRVLRTAPSPWSLGRLDRPDLTREVFAAVGAQLCSLGVDIAFAPLADVNVRAENPVIGSRAFGADPARVSRHVRAALVGLHGSGVWGCPKHFPGHGATSRDSHLELPRVDDTLEVIRERDLAPFQDAIDGGAQFIMAGHLHVPSLDERARPATRSARILGDLLRGEMGFQGVVVSDALEMAGFEDDGSGSAVAEALHAGVDLFLVARGRERARAMRRALARAVAGSTKARTAVERSRARIETTPVGPAPDPAGDPAGEVEGTETGIDPGRASIELLNAHVIVTGGDDRPPVSERAPADGDPGSGLVILVPGEPPDGFLSADRIRASLETAAPAAIVQAIGEELVDAELDGAQVAALVLFLRGGLTPADRGRIASLEGWRSGAPGRSALALLAADDAPAGAIPESWQVRRLGGSHRTAFEALWRGGFDGTAGT